MEELTPRKSGPRRKSPAAPVPAGAKAKKERRPSIFAVLKSLPALIKWGDRDLKQIHDSLIPKNFKDGEVIVSAGEPQTTLYIIRTGEVNIVSPDAKKAPAKLNSGHRPSKVGSLRAMFEAAAEGRRGKGFCFGELAVSQLAGPQTSHRHSITAVGPVTTLCVSHAQFMLTKMLLAKRYVVAAEGYQPELERKAKPVASVAERERFGVTAAPTVKTDAERAVILSALKNVVLLKELEDGQLNAVVDVMWEQEIKIDTTLIQQGEKGEVFYVVKRGEFVVFQDDVYVARKPEGAGFGELALMHNALRSATVLASVDSIVWCVYRWQVRRIIANWSANKIQQRLEFLHKVKSFDVLFDAEKKKLAEVLEEQKFAIGEMIVRQGDEGDTFYIIKEGEVKVEVKDKDGEILPVNTYRSGDYFGELSLMLKQARAATVSAQTAVVCYVLHSKHFTVLLGSMSDLFGLRRSGYRKSIESTRRIITLKKSISEGSAAAAIPEDEDFIEEKKECLPVIPERKFLDVKSIDDITIIGTLGRGAFGHVQLVKLKTDSTIHALKTLNKSLLVETKQVASVKRERNVLAMINHPSLIQYRGWFQDLNHMHLLMEPTLGGELASVLSEREVLTEEEARFMSANIVLAFEYMHSIGVVYRDLKPENVLLDRQGYLKFVDFGFAKKIDDNKTYTLCGTPDYLAPEVISGQGHNMSADWWTLGVVIYEMLLGETPFYADTPMGTYSNIMKCEFSISEDSGLSPEARSLILALMTKEAPLRLGATKGGVQSIKDHPFYAKHNFDWKALEARTMVAPIIRAVENEEDIRNFEDYLGEDERWKSYHPELLEEPDPFLDF